MELLLKRPLVFFDLEATGPDRAQDRITQFCFEIHYPDRTKDVFDAVVDPGIPIPEKIAELTGITNEMVSGRPHFSFYAYDVFALIKGADLVGFGCLQFDVPLLFNELHRSGFEWDYTACHIIDAGNIFKRQVPRDLSSALLHYTGRKLIGAHNAKTDVDATRQVFLYQLQHHDLRHRLPEDLRSLALYSNYDKPVVDLSGKFSVDAEGDVIFNFSNNKGQKVKENVGMLHWMLGKDFSEDVKIICRQLIEKYTPVREYDPEEFDLPF